MSMRHLMLILPVLALAACQNASDKDAPTGDGKTLAEKEAASSTTPSDSKTAPLTETAIPNKPANPAAADVESQDLAALKAQLNALSGDISRMRGDLASPETEATNTVVPDTQTSTPRALVTDGIVKIPDSREELAAKDQVTVKAVRVGAHTDKTRLVFELSQDPIRKPEVELSGKVLKIKIFDAKWANGDSVLASQTGSLGVSSVTEELSNVVITITLNHADTLKDQMVLPPAEVGGAYRLVVDLGAGN